MEQNYNAAGIKYPALLADPRYAAVQGKPRNSIEVRTATKADTLIALVATALLNEQIRSVDDMRKRSGLYTRRSRELAMTVGQENYSEAMKVAVELAAEVLAYDKACEAVR